MLKRLKGAVNTLWPKGGADTAGQVIRLQAEVKELQRAVRGDRSSFKNELKAVHAKTVQERKAASALVDAQVETTASAVKQQLRDVQRAIDGIDARLADVTRRCAQLVAIAETQAKDVDREASVYRLLDSERTSKHVAAAVAAATLETAPFPHLVVDSVLPSDLHQALVRALPSPVLFEDRRADDQQVKVPPRLASPLSYRLWRFLGRDVVNGELQDAIIDRFQEPLSSLLHSDWPDVELRHVGFDSTNNHILRQQAGHTGPSHRQDVWGWLTAILYLAGPENTGGAGTELHRTEGTERSAVAFVPNRLLVFLNEPGTACRPIPTDVNDVERYTYQYRIGPDATSVDALTARLTPEARGRWETKAKRSRS